MLSVYKSLVIWVVLFRLLILCTEGLLVCVRDGGSSPRGTLVSIFVWSELDSKQCLRLYSSQECTTELSLKYLKLHVVIALISEKGAVPFSFLIGENRGDIQAPH